MNAIAKIWKQDKEGTLAVIILVAIVVLYLVGMCLWLLYEWNVPVKEVRVVDVTGDLLAAKVSHAIYKKLFKRDKG
jgi:hypothetical protein